MEGGTGHHGDRPPEETGRRDIGKGEKRGTGYRAAGPQMAVLHAKPQRHPGLIRALHPEIARYLREIPLQKGGQRLLVHLQRHAFLPGLLPVSLAKPKGGCNVSQ